MFLGWYFQSQLVLPGTNRHHTNLFYRGLVVYVYWEGSELLVASCTPEYKQAPQKREKKIPTNPQTPDNWDIYFCSSGLVASMVFCGLDLINKQYDQIAKFTLCLLESSADYLYKQFRPRSDPTKTSGLIWMQPVCHYGGNPLGKYRVMKEKSADNKTT